MRKYPLQLTLIPPRFPCSQNRVIGSDATSSFLLNQRIHSDHASLPGQGLVRHLFTLEAFPGSLTVQLGLLPAGGCLPTDGTPQDTQHRHTASSGLSFGSATMIFCKPSFSRPLKNIYELDPDGDLISY